MCAQMRTPDMARWNVACNFLLNRAQLLEAARFLSHIEWGIVEDAL